MNIHTGPQATGSHPGDAAEAAGATRLRRHGQIVLVLQGGGALGAYQLGVYEALHAAGIEPDWIIGTSIGAINAALIAGNAPEDRLARLCEFWRRVEHGPHYRALSWLGAFAASASAWLTVAHGIPAFFQPNPAAFLGAQVPLGAEQAGYYSTQPLLATLAELVDFDRINAGPIRLTVGAANVRSGEMTYFDSRERPLGPRHVAASGALPPAFPAVRIDGDLYWDGGILSNTPVEAVFDDMPRRNSLVFAVHIWNPNGPEPETVWNVMNRQKDIQYASRAASHIARQKQMHRLRHIIAGLARKLPADIAAQPDVKDMAAYGCLTRMHVVRLLAPSLDGEDHTKDIDFSSAGIRNRRDAGRRDAEAVLSLEPWEGEFDPMEGFILHEVRQGVEVSAG